MFGGIFFIIVLSSTIVFIILILKSLFINLINEKNFLEQGMRDAVTI